MDEPATVSSATAPEERSALVLSVIKAFGLLEAIAAAEDGLTLGEISKQNKLHASTAHRLLQTMIEIGYVRQDLRTRRYHLGARTYTLATPTRFRTDIEALAQPLLRRLAEQVEESARLYVLDGAEIVTLGQAEPPKASRLFSSIGGHMPAHCTAGGKALLAHLSPAALAEQLRQRPLVPCTPNTITHVDDLQVELDRIRRRGYAVDDEEQEIGVRCVAAVVRNHTGAAVAAVSISGPSGRVSVHHLTELALHVQETARLLSHEMGYRGV
jgi:DNA-binding IclR family transcriptional regulator